MLPSIYITAKTSIWGSFEDYSDASIHSQCSSPSANQKLLEGAHYTSATGAKLVTDRFPSAIYWASGNLYNVCSLAPSYLQECIFSMEFALITQTVQEKIHMDLYLKEVGVARLPSTAFGMVPVDYPSDSHLEIFQK